MKASFESELTRSVALGAYALWRFSRSYYDRMGRKEAAPFLSSFLVLPIVFHQVSVVAIADRVKDGALLKALTEEPTIVVGLQRRLESMGPRSFRALNLAMTSEMVRLDRASGLSLVPMLKSEPFKYSSDEASKVIKAADRLGHSIAGTGFGAACSLLSVRF